MDRSISDELYSEALRLSNGGPGPNSQAYHHHSGSFDNKLDHLSNDDDDGSLWDDSEEHNIQSDLDREWQKRHDQFHTIGYRDGLTAGKEASAQEGFNIGFKDSILVGYRWGLIRGVTSALACLPDGLRDKIVESKEERDKFESLYESVHSISTMDALKSFHDSFVAKRPAEYDEGAEASADVADPEVKSSNVLQNFSEEFKSLILKTPEIEVNFMIDK